MPDKGMTPRRQKSCEGTGQFPCSLANGSLLSHGIPYLPKDSEKTWQLCNLSAMRLRPTVLRPALSKRFALYRLKGSDLLASAFFFLYRILSHET